MIERAVVEASATADRHLRERVAALVGLTERLATARPEEDLFTVIADGARGLIGAAGATLHLVEGEELVLVASTGDGNGARPASRAPIGREPEGQVATSGRPIRLADVLEKSVDVAAAPAGPRRRSYLGVPLLARDRVCGVLAVHAGEAARFNDDDLTLLRGLAGPATVAIESVRLTQQLLHAERLSTVGAIVAGVAHELNNPLAAILGTVDLLQTEPVDARLAERLGRIAGQAHRAGGIVRSLLSLTRKRSAQRVPVALNELVAGTLDLQEYELRQASVSVVRRLDDGLPPIRVDPHQLQQVFTNLVLNAVDAMREAHGGGVLTITTRPDGGADRVIVEIEDDGPGIPAHVLPRIFEPFFTTKGDEKGTGLGLAICRRIVEGHGGRIAVESPPGAGAVFAVTLPVGREVPEEPAPAGPEAPPASREVRVLVVEDEVVVGDLLAEFLTVEGHRVDRATNGREALERVRGGPYELIVSDIRMPDLDGLAFYRELHAVDPGLARRVVFVTGDTMSPVTRQFLDETGLLHLEKPFSLGEFQATVRRALSRP